MVKTKNVQIFFYLSVLLFYFICGIDLEILSIVYFYLYRYQLLDFWYRNIRYQICPNYSLYKILYFCCVFPGFAIVYDSLTPVLSKEGCWLPLSAAGIDEFVLAPCLSDVDDLKMPVQCWANISMKGKTA